MKIIQSSIFGALKMKFCYKIGGEQTYKTNLNIIMSIVIAEWIIFTV